MKTFDELDHSKIYNKTPAVDSWESNDAGTILVIVERDGTIEPGHQARHLIGEWWIHKQRGVYEFTTEDFIKTLLFKEDSP